MDKWCHPNTLQDIRLLIHAGIKFDPLEKRPPEIQWVNSLSGICVDTVTVISAVWKICKAWWHHQMETFSALLALCAGNSPVTGEFLSAASDAGLWCSLICGWINGWVNNRNAGDLRRHHAHYDVTVMGQSYCWRICYSSIYKERSYSI